jgi:ABC-type glycerol-3-phosphate transport system permease component
MSGPNTKLKLWLASLGVHTILIIGAILSVGPLYWVVKSSFTPIADIFTYPPELIPMSFSWDGYIRLFASVPFLQNMGNSVLVATIYTGLTVFLSSLVGFGFAKFQKAPGAKVLFFIVLTSIMVPFQTLALSLFVHIARLQWVNTYQGLIIPLMANGFSAFLMTQFMQSFPDEILDAARIDGCTYLRAFIAVVLPLVRPALGAVAVLQFIHSWNDFFWPLIVLTEEKMYTVPVVLGSFAVQQAVVPYDMIAAGITLASVPMVIVFLFAQKQFIAGLTLGAIKS